jgi:hypothetical protein
VADSVTERAASDRHSVSTLSWMMMTCPGSERTICRTASALLPSGRVMSVTPGCRHGQRQHRAHDVEQPAGVAEPVFDRQAGQHALVRADDDDVAAGGCAPGGNETRQQQLQALECGRVLLVDRCDAVETLGEKIGDRRHVAPDRGALLPALVDHLHEGAEADGDQEGDDKGGHRTAKRRLRNQQPMVGRFCDRLRQSLDRIGLDARARRVDTRHALDPLGYFLHPFGKDPSPFPNHSDLNPVLPGCRESTIR